MHLVADDRPWQNISPPIGNDGAFRPVSYWQETVAITPGAPLAENINCDVAIVGGGFTGLSVAYALKSAHPELDVVLLERAVVGYGASGRNGGFAMPLIGWDLADAAKKLGDDGARDAYRLMYQAVAYLKDIVARHAIPCDLEATGYLLVATSRRKLHQLRHEADLGKKLGFDFQWLEGGALHEYIRSDSFVAGVFDPHPAIVNPAKLARGMKDVVEQMGVRVYEQTPLQTLRDGDPLAITTPGGEVRAKAVCMALNGYAGAVGFMERSVLPVHTYIVMTEPLTDAQLEEIGWAKRRTSIETYRKFIHHFRLTADNRITFGGEDADLYYGGRYLDHDERTFQALHERFCRYFPSLREVKITHRWGGVLGVSLDMFPTFGVQGDHKNIFHAGAYCGHGVSLSNYAGQIMAPPMLRRLGMASGDGPSAFFYGRNPTWLPPDPLRYVGLKAYRLMLRADDRRHGA